MPVMKGLRGAPIMQYYTGHAHCCWCALRTQHLVSSRQGAPHRMCAQRLLM